MFVIPSWALGAAVILIAIQIGRAISGKYGGRGRLRGRNRELSASDDEISELRQNLETMQTRVAELEERVDFAERLLAKQRDSDRLGGSGGGGGGGGQG
jgi:hypothetical protein